MTYNLRFAGFEEEWNSYFLEDVIKSFVNGQTPSRNVDSYWNGEIPWVSSGELNYNHITSTIEQITEEGKGKANLKLLPAGTFLMAITGLEAAGTRGSCAILDIEATTNQSCMALFPKEDKLTTKFLYYWYLKVGEHYGIKYTQGTKQQSYNKELLEKLPIVIPDNLKEQDKITDCLSLLHFKIELLEKKYKSYVDFKKYLMQQIFAQKLRFADYIDEWKTIKLKDIGEINTGNTPSTAVDEYYSPKKYLWVTPSDISKKYIFDTAKGLSDEGAKKGRFVKKNSVLVTCIASIGKNCIILEDGYFNQQINSITPSQSFDLEFIYYLIDYNSQKMKNYAGITATPILNKKSFENMKFEFPSFNEQKQIGNILSKVDDKIFSIEEMINKTQKYKKGLLQQMFNNVRLVVINLIINEYICPL